MHLQALDNLQCKRRVLLSGTPMQNHLDEVSHELLNAVHFGSFLMCRLEHELSWHLD